MLVPLCTDDVHECLQSFKIRVQRAISRCRVGAEMEHSMNDTEIIRLGLQGIKIMPLETRLPKGASGDKRRRRIPGACLKKLMQKHAA